MLLLRRGGIRGSAGGGRIPIGAHFDFLDERGALFQIHLDGFLLNVKFVSYLCDRRGILVDLS